MPDLLLVRDSCECPISKDLLSQQFPLFSRDPTLLNSDRYEVRADVKPNSLSSFVDSVKTGEEIRFTAFTLFDFVALSQEFGFCSFENKTGFSARLDPIEEELNRLKTLLESSLFDFEFMITREKREIKLDVNKPFEGIISHLKKYEKKLPLEKIVTIRSNTGVNTRNLADTSLSEFRSDDLLEQWICWDFHQLRVAPKQYQIRSATVAHPKDWVLEVSIDGEKWTPVDKRQDNYDLFYWESREKSKVATFIIENIQEGRYIRLTQTNTNHDGNNVLALASCEFFGDLFDRPTN
jgi:hypothetical protein